MKKIDLDFYQGNDVVEISRLLLGKYLVTRFDNAITGGVIVETEAYAGATDKASHAYGGRRTARTEIMYAEGGVSYVYLCYGIHHLFNVVTNKKDIPHAVLIRAIEPIEGLDVMMLRRKKDKIDFTLTSGPGAMSEALGIKTKHTGIDMTGDQIWIEDKNYTIGAEDIIAGPRVGVAYAKEDALLPYRFSIKNNKWVSRAK